MRSRGTGGRRRVAGITIGGGVVGVVVLVVVLALAPDDSLRKVRASGVIRIGYALEAPYAFLLADGGLIGESIEVARWIAARMGIERTEWVQADFPKLITGHEEKRFEVIAAGLFITPERSRRVASSNPTFRVDQALLVPAGNPKALHSYRDAAERTDVRIAVISRAAEEALLVSLGMRVPRLVVVSDALTGRAAVETGVADGLALSHPMVR